MTEATKLTEDGSMTTECREQLMTIREVSTYLKVAERTIHRYVEKGMLNKSKFGGVIRFEQEEVRRLAGQKEN